MAVLPDVVKLAACETGFGWVGIARGNGGLLGLTLPGPSEQEALQQLSARHGPGVLECEGVGELVARLQAYFRGDRETFQEERLDARGSTTFQRRVWAATRAIPYAQTVTYGELAGQIGSPGAARAVGQAMARNPWPIVVPCHRVIGQGGQLTGFGGGLDMKRRLLELEGARI